MKTTTKTIAEDLTIKINNARKQHGLSHYLDTSHLYDNPIDPDTLIDKESNHLDAINNSMVKENLWSILRKELTPRERAVLDYRFGLTDRYPMTLQDVGKCFSVGRERIRGIECKALRKLRRPDNLRKTEELLCGKVFEYSY